MITWDQLKWETRSKAAEAGFHHAIVDTPEGKVGVLYDPPKTWPDGTYVRPWICFEPVEAKKYNIHVELDLVRAACFLVAIQQGEPVEWNKAVYPSGAMMDVT